MESKNNSDNCLVLNHSIEEVISFSEVVLKAFKDSADANSDSIKEMMIYVDDIVNILHTFKDNVTLVDAAILPPVKKTIN